MSSLVRRIQKRIAKGQGFFRHRDGLIYNSQLEVVGTRWPQVQAPTRPIEEKG